MKKISNKEYVKLLFEILEYVDDLCEKNNIQYTLTGGSLIGAIRHSDIIPWDDDIDIALTPENYDKFKHIMLEQNSRYKFIDNSVEDTYYVPFAKVIDSYTDVYEGNNRRAEIHGVYIDVFKINNTSNNKFLRNRHYNMVSKFKRIFGIFAMNDERLKNESNLIKKVRNYFLFKIGCRFFIKRYNRLTSKYNKKQTNYVFSNWPTYGYDHETMLKKWYKTYKKTKFGSIDAMVIDNYDEVLKTAFGNYMELPPENERIPHHDIEAYWKVNDSEKK